MRMPDLIRWLGDGDAREVALLTALGDKCHHGYVLVRDGDAAVLICLENTRTGAFIERGHVNQRWDAGPSGRFWGSHWDQRERKMVRQSRCPNPHDWGRTVHQVARLPFLAPVSNEVIRDLLGRPRRVRKP